MRHTNCLQSSIGNRRICKSINSDIKTRRQVQWVGISYGRTSSCIYTERNEKKDDVYNKYFCFKWYTRGYILEPAYLEKRTCQTCSQ